MAIEVGTTESRRYRRALAITLAVAFVVRMLIAYLMPNLVWPDEIFQTLEQAHRAVFGTGIVPWEYRDGIRSWMLPGLLAAVIKLTSWVTASVTAYVMACAALMSLISLAPVWAVFKEAYTQFGLRAAIVAGAFLALWFELIFFAPKAMTEVVAGNCLAFGVVAGVACARSAVRNDGTLRRGQVAVFAVMVTLAAMLRIQLAPAALVVFAVIYLKLPRPAKWVSVVVAAGIVVAAGMLDAITWSYPFQSYIENVRVNVLHGKSAYYGTSTWDAYFAVYVRIWGVWGIPILALAVLGARRAPLLAVTALLVLAAHIPIAHKEYRFAYPAMVLVIMLAALGAAAVQHWVETHKPARLASLSAVGLIALWFAISAVGANGFHASKTQLALFYGDEQDHWVRRRGGLLAMRKLGETPEICGVALAGIGWGDTGGYSYLHRDIPLFALRDQYELGAKAAHFNALLMKPDKPPEIGPFIRDECWEDLCIYLRAGDCTPLVGYDINRSIEQMKQ